MAISPGGRGIVLAGGRKNGGSLDLATALVFFLPAVSIVTVPVSAHYLLPDAHIATRTLIVVIAVFQLVPLFVGLFLNERTPEVAARLDRPVLIVLLIALLVVLVPLLPATFRSITGVYGSQGILAILAIVVLSVLTGWVLGGPQREYRRTLGLGTALRSFAFCAVIATESFPGTEATAAVLTYFVIQMVVTGLIGIYFQRTAGTAAA
jgi:predicted Na+-dependent transporter